MKRKMNIAVVAFVIFHLLLIAVFFVPFTTSAFLCLFFGYFIRMFFVTAGYHRYFSHRTYSASRFVQFLLAFMAQTSSQKGILWWTAHHRKHHQHADQELDAHSPSKGFLWAHCGWFLSTAYESTDFTVVKDFSKFPELVWLNRYWSVPVFIYGFFLLYLGGWSAVFWGLGVSTVLLWHGTFTINSLAHIWGRRKYETADQSKNNFVLALITLGEGWHNNHHKFPAAVRNGFLWWEVDITYYFLWLFDKIGLISNLRPVPARAFRLV